MSNQMKKGSGVASFLSRVESKKQEMNDVPQQSNPNIETWNDGTTAGARLVKDVQPNIQSLWNEATTPNGYERMFNSDTRKNDATVDNVRYLAESALQGAKNSGYGIANTFNEMNKYYDPTIASDNPYAFQKLVEETPQRVEGVKKLREDLYQAQDTSNQQFNEKYADKEGAIKLAGEVAQGVGGMIPNIAANMVIPGAGMATMFASATGNKYKEAIQDGATDNQALLSGVLSGGVEVATEKLFDGISALGKGLGLEKKIINWLGNRITGPATKQVLEKVIGIMGEGAEEAISEYANAFITKIYNDNGKDFVETMIDTTPDALYSAMIGAITSGVLEGGTNVVSNGAKSFLNKVESAKTQNINSNQPNLADTEQLQQNDVVSGMNPNIAQIDSNKPTYNFDVASQQDLDTINNLAKRSNTRIEWIESSNDVNGMYSNGTIYLNKNKSSSDNYTTVMVHELTHHLENSGFYEALKSMAYNHIKQKGYDLDNIRTQITKDYSNHVENLTADDVEREVIAKYAEEFLFKDQEAINRLARTDRNLFQKVYDWIKDTIQYVKSSAEKQKLMDIERMYVKALSNVDKISNTSISSSIGGGLSSYDNHKQKQLDIILKNNPAEDDYHTWIRELDDIKTFEEAMQDPDYLEGDFDPDYTRKMAEDALKNGYITVYSSKPIENGIFVTPSKMEAMAYSGNGKVYTKKVNLTDVAWIEPTQGQYAPVNESYSVGGSLSSYDTENRQLSQAQQEYFKDSKVRDENGNLMVVYHGTPNGDFNVYDKSMLGTNTEALDSNLGFHFTDSKELADYFKTYGESSNGVVKEQYLDIKKPLDIMNQDENELAQDLYYILTGEEAEDIDDVIDTVDSLRQGYYPMHEFKDELANPEAVSRMKELGYDGIIMPIAETDVQSAYEENGSVAKGYEYIVFDSNQIKNVDNTNPTESEDIRYSRGKKLSEYDIKPSQLTQTDLNLASDLAKSFGIQDVSSLENNIRPIAQELESTGRLSVESKDKLYRFVSNNTTGDELLNDLKQGKSNVRHYEFDQAMNNYIASKLNEVKTSNDYSNVEQNQDHRATFGNDTNETTQKVENRTVATEKTTKVKDYEKAAKNHLVKYLAKEFNVSPYQVKSLVGDFIDRAGMQIQTQNRVDSYLMKDIFNKMSEHSYTIDDEMRRTYQPLIDDLKATTFKLDQDTRNGMSDNDLKAFKKEHRNRFKIGDNGIPVDSKYQELATKYPEHFPSDLSSGDMLNRIAEVLESFDDKYSRNSDILNNDPVMKEASIMEFNTAYNNFLDSMRNAQNVANEIAAKKELKDSFDYNFYKEQQAKISKLKREYEKVQRKIVLDNKGTHFLNGLMSGAITIDDVDAEYRNDVLSMYRVKKPYEDAKNITKTYQSIYKQGLRDKARGLISSIEGWKVHKKLNGLSFEMDTAERTIRDIAGDDAEAIIKEYFEPIHANEAEATRFKNKWKAKLKALNLSGEEAAAVQMLGERADIGGREYTEADVVEAGLDLEKITNAVNEFKQMYNELYDQVNEVLVRNGYAAIEFRKDYFPHFIDAEPNTKLGKVLKKFGLNIAQDDLNADIAGLTEHFRPGKTWFGHAMHRTSNLTKYNALEGADRYLDGIANVIYHTDDIQKLRALDTEIRYQASDDGFKAAIDEIYDDENLFEEERQSKLQELYEKQGKVSTFGNLTTWLTNYTNNLANKKSAADRQMEYDLGRGMYTISKQLEGRVAANMVAASASSAMSNFIPITQALGECKATDIVKAMSQTMSTNFKNDGFVDESVFLTNRKGTDKLVKTKLQDLSDKFSIPFEMVDNFVSSTIVRAKYLGNLDKGMTHEQAMQDADSYAASLMADRSKGAMPLVFERKNPVAKMFTMFQLEQNNQINYLLKDLPRKKKEEAATAILMAIMRMAIGAWAFNEINQLIFGRRSALDPIDMAYSSWKTATDENMKTSEKVKAIGKEVVEEVPFIGGLMGGGRIPLQTALPDLDSASKLVFDYDELSPEQRSNYLMSSIVKPLSYVVSPFGAGQAWKTYEGLSAYADGGVYNVTADGKKLKYAVDDNIVNLFRAAIGGKSSFPEATEYYDSGRSPLSVKQTAAFEKASSLGADKEQLIEAMYRAKGIDSMKNSNGETIKLSKAAQIRKMLDEYDFTTSQKKALYESIGVSKSIADMTSLEFKNYLKENNIK